MTKIYKGIIKFDLEAVEYEEDGRIYCVWKKDVEYHKESKLDDNTSEKKRVLKEVQYGGRYRNANICTMRNRRDLERLGYKAYKITDPTDFSQYPPSIWTAVVISTEPLEE